MNPLHSLKGAIETPRSKPLLGTTILLVEDSRFVCDAMRLVSVHSGARLRHADTIASATRHLRIYRPNVVIIDEGLMDGSGSDFLRELHAMQPRIDALFGTSGDMLMHHTFLGAGADGFFEKPMVNISEFQQKILSVLPQYSETGFRPVILSDENVEPNPKNYVEDLKHAYALLSDEPNMRMKGYVSQFLKSVCNSAGDRALMTSLERDEQGELMELLDKRISAPLAY